MDSVDQDTHAEARGLVEVWRVRRAPPRQLEVAFPAGVAAPRPVGKLGGVIACTCTRTRMLVISWIPDQLDP